MWMLEEFVEFKLKLFGVCYLEQYFTNMDVVYLAFLTPNVVWRLLIIMFPRPK